MQKSWHFGHSAFPAALLVSMVLALLAQAPVQPSNTNSAAPAAQSGTNRAPAMDLTSRALTNSRPGISATLSQPREQAVQFSALKRRAEEGNARAQFNLGLMYDQGRGMLPDYGEAARWYRLAADQGVAVAQYRLGLMYHDGQGVTRDYVQAYMWFSLAVAQFPNSDNEDRQDAIEARDLVGSKMSQIEIAKARNLALRWRIRSNQY